MLFNRLTTFLTSNKEYVPFINCIIPGFAKIFELFQNLVDFEFVLFTVPREGLVNIQSFISDNSDKDGYPDCIIFISYPSS